MEQATQLQPGDWPRYRSLRSFQSAAQPCAICGVLCARPTTPMPVAGSGSYASPKRLHVVELFQWGPSFRAETRSDLDLDHSAKL